MSLYCHLHCHVFKQLNQLPLYFFTEILSLWMVIYVHTELINGSDFDIYTL